MRQVADAFNEAEPSNRGLHTGNTCSRMSCSACMPGHCQAHTGSRHRSLHFSISAQPAVCIDAHQWSEWASMNRKPGRKPFRGDRRRHAEVEHVRPRTPAKRDGRGGNTVEGIPRNGHIVATFQRQQKPSARPLEQLDAQGIFEIFDVPADCALGEQQFIGCERKTAQPRRGLKGPHGHQGWQLSADFRIVAHAAPPRPTPRASVSLLPQAFPRTGMIAISALSTQGWPSAGTRDVMTRGGPHFILPPTSRIRLHWLLGDTSRKVCRRACRKGLSETSAVVDRQPLDLGLRQLCGNDSHTTVDIVATLA